MTVVPDRDGLALRHPAALLEALERRARSGGPFKVTPRELASETAATAEAALRLLRDRALEGWLEESQRFTCPHCDEELSAEEAAGELCPFDSEVAFSDHGGVRRHELFTHHAPPTRDVRWVLALHGMNTRGAWQEAFNWMFARAYGGGYMVPVAIYKYGVIRPGVVARWRQRQLVRRVAAQIRRLVGETEEAGFGGVPDVVAHSFGTWLLGHALLSEPDLRVGRVILLGCPLRPDFDWSRLIDAGRVEAVLNHYGTADIWVRMAQRFIPCSGPAGRRGFDQEAVHNVPAPGFGHSRFFDEAVMPGEFARLWQPFLTWPAAKLADLPGRHHPGEPWRPSRWKVRPSRDRCTFPPPAACH